jgi:hypothetical protein
VAVASGTRGAGAAALAKVLAVCVGTVGGAAACVATGVVPIPLEAENTNAPRHERLISPADEATASEDAAVEYLPSPESSSPEATEAPKHQESTAPPESDPEPEASSGAVEYTPPPVEATAATTSSSSSAAADPAGEFGP